MKWFWIVLLLILAAGAGTYGRYQSLDPCVWLEKDMVAGSNMPELWVEARIRARFLLEGIANPTAIDCLQGWWSFRAEELAETERAD